MLLHSTHFQNGQLATLLAVLLLLVLVSSRLNRLRFRVPEVYKVLKSL